MTKHILLYLVTFLIVVPAVSIKAQELDSLRAEVKSLRQQVSRIDDLERRLAQVANDSSYTKFQEAKAQNIDASQTQVLQIPREDLRESSKNLTGKDLIDDEFIGSWPMFGTEFRMKLGGYVKADLICDFDGTLDKSQLLMSTIPVEGTPEHANSGYFYMMSKETRFNIDVRRITPGKIPLQLFIEGDFWAAGTQFRLRHAYAVVGNFLVGQNWTTLSLLETLPYMMDFGGGDALFGGRATQIRYQKRVSTNWKLAVAIENLDFAGIENPNNLHGEASFALPLLALRADYKWKTGLVILGTSFAQLRWDGGAGGPDTHALQWDGVVGGRQYIGKNNYFTWNISGGIGSGENIMAFMGSQANAVLNANGKLETMPAFAFVGGFMHKWTDKLSSNLVYAYGWIDTPSSRAPLALKEGGISHINLIYRPIKSFSTGIEYMWGTAVTTNKSEGKAGRLQMMVKYEF